MDTVTQKIKLLNVQEMLGTEYRLKAPRAIKGNLPTFEHARTQIEFKLVFGGEFIMGLADLEERAARAILDPPPLNISELRPARKLTVRSFLVSTTPMLVDPVRKLFGDSYLSPYLQMAESNPNAPLYVQRETALRIAESLGCRLPYEREWEYACRAHTQTLFVWGNKLPKDSELEKWLDFGVPRSKWRANSFGLFLLFAGDWCMDEWADSHEEGAQVTHGASVIKGGGSMFWPWQDQEWIWCMPANRMPSTGLTEDGCAFRLVKELPVDFS